MYTILSNWKYALLLLIAGLGLIWTSRDTTGALSGSNAQAMPQVGFPAPDFTLEDLHGKQIVLSNLRGKAILLNFWASWCPPCREEMPALQRVYQDYQNSGLVVLAVNATNQDERIQAENFTSQMALTFPVLLDTDGSVLKNYLVQSLPTTYLIDQSGKIVEIVVGGPMAEALLRVRATTLLEGDLP